MKSAIRSQRAASRSISGPAGSSASVELSAREFELLRTFLKHPNQVLSREQLLAQDMRLRLRPGSNVVDVYVGYLRRKLGSESFKTVRGVGYRYRV
ncbi:MAG: winged helix-turn-helix domain-containing protein [Solirubrobacterales bacterium]